MAGRSLATGTTVCVLGGSGFLGSHLVRQLLADGAHVRSLSLPSPTPFPVEPSPALETFTGDIRDPAAVRAAVAGSRFVFLAAGPVPLGSRSASAMRAHPDGLRTVLGAIPAGSRLVLTSSVVTVGASRAGEELTEDATFDSGDVRVAYVAAKRAAEEEALAAAAGGRDVVVVNPGYLFGPDDPGPSVMGQICVRYWRGRIPFAPPGGLNAVDVRDAAAGHVLAAAVGVAGRRYILGGENLTNQDLFARLAVAAGVRQAWLPRLPGRLLTALAVCAEGHARLVGRTPFPSLDHARMNRRYWYYSSARAAAELGYRPRPLADTLADAYRWHGARTRVTPRGLNRWLFRRAA